MNKIEYAIWGKEHNNPDETLLFTKLVRRKDCESVMNILESRYKCRDMRVQVIHLSNGNDIQNMFKKGLTQ